jgi:hypothetical protein
MKLIIAGSRGITESVVLSKALVKYELANRITEVVSGGARGVDTLGENFARVNGIPCKRFNPDWGKGRGAGMIRNRDMGSYADELLAIWDGESRGTKQMIEYMRTLGKPTWVYITKED